MEDKFTAPTWWIVRKIFNLNSPETSGEFVFPVKGVRNHPHIKLPVTPMSYFHAVAVCILHHHPDTSSNWLRLAGICCSLQVTERQRQKTKWCSPRFDDTSYNTRHFLHDSFPSSPTSNKSLNSNVCEIHQSRRSCSRYLLDEGRMELNIGDGWMDRRKVRRCRRS